MITSNGDFTYVKSANVPTCFFFLSFYYNFCQKFKLLNRSIRSMFIALFHSPWAMYHSEQHSSAQIFVHLSYYYYIYLNRHTLKLKRSLKTGFFFYLKIVNLLHPSKYRLSLNLTVVDFYFFPFSYVSRILCPLQYFKNSHSKFPTTSRLRYE